MAVCNREESKMAYINFRLTNTIFKSQLIHTSGSLRSSLIFVYSPTPKTWVQHTAFGISLLSCIRAEKHVISYQLPVDGRQIWFPTYPDVVQSSHKSLRIAWPRKDGYRSLNFVPIMSTNWDIHYLLFLLPVNRRHRCNGVPVMFTRWNMDTSGLVAAILESHFRL